MFDFLQKENHSAASNLLDQAKSKVSPIKVKFDILIDGIYTPRCIDLYHLPDGNFLVHGSAPTENKNVIDFTASKGVNATAYTLDGNGKVVNCSKGDKGLFAPIGYNFIDLIIDKHTKRFINTMQKVTESGLKHPVEFDTIIDGLPVRKKGTMAPLGKNLYLSIQRVAIPFFEAKEPPR